MGPVGKMAPGDLWAVEGQCWGNPTRLAAMDGGVAPVPEGRASAAGGVASICKPRGSEVRFVVLSTGRGSRVEYNVSRGGPAGIVWRPGTAYRVRGSLLYMDKDLAGSGGKTFDTPQLRQGSGGPPISWMARYSWGVSSDVTRVVSGVVGEFARCLNCRQRR